MANILFAEDDLSIQSIVARALEMDDHHVTKTSDGQEALDVLMNSQCKYDLLLSDVKMPGMDGIELAYCVHTLVPEMRILMISGHLIQNAQLDDDDNIIRNMVQKPFSLTQIRKAVRDILDAPYEDKAPCSIAIGGYFSNGFERAS